MTHTTPAIINTTKPTNAEAPSASPASPASPMTAAELHTQVAQVIERIRPSIQADGGDLTFVGVTDAGVVQVQLHGACVGCPSSSMTLKMGIEKNLVDHVPGVVAVEQVD